MQHDTIQKWQHDTILWGNSNKKKPSPHRRRYFDVWWYYVTPDVLRKFWLIRARFIYFFSVARWLPSAQIWQMKILLANFLGKNTIWARCVNLLTKTRRTKCPYHCFDTVYLDQYNIYSVAKLKTTITWSVIIRFLKLKLFCNQEIKTNPTMYD
jgi:hypothetical protein